MRSEGFKRRTPDSVCVSPRARIELYDEGRMNSRVGLANYSFKIYRKNRSRSCVQPCLAVLSAVTAFSRNFNGFMSWKPLSSHEDLVKP